MEREGVGEIRVRADPRGTLEQQVAALRIKSLRQGGTSYPGSIYPTIEAESERTGTMIDGTGESLPSWLAEWIGQPEQADNRSKLDRSGAAERHLFIILPGFADAPSEVVDLLMWDEPPLPAIAPTLPREITHVWIASTWTTSSGMRWGPDVGWVHFDKQMQALRHDAPTC